MRPVAGFHTAAAAAAAAAVAAPAASTASSAIHSAWHSPVPYLFGGLAAMLGLIAFALLILACSYWKLSGYLEGGAAARGDARASDVGDEKPPAASMLPPPIWEEKIVVIMAGELKPTYLATPMSSRNSSFGEHSNKGEEDKEETKDKEVAMGTLKEAQHSEEDESQRVRGSDQVPEV